MSQTKSKVITREKSLEKRKFGLRPKLQATDEITGDQIEKLWKEELQQIRQSQFASEEEASLAIIDSVLDRLSLSKQARADTREFLELVLATDEDFKHQLRKCVCIR